MRQTDTAVFWQLEFRWLKATMTGRIAQLVNLGQVKEDFDLGVGPDLDIFPNPYTAMLREHSFSNSERKILALALAPALFPSLLAPLIDTRKSNEEPVIEFGGKRQGASFLPTAETALFLLGGSMGASRLRYLRIFDAEHPFRKYGLLELGETMDGQPATMGVLKPSAELLALARGIENFEPEFGLHFPARKLETRLEWADLVLCPASLSHIGHLRSWMKHSDDVLEGMGLQRILAPGYRVLFHGPPGTGKTMTASLLGKELGMEVYRVDLSMVVSKYIGETEKNLEKVFQAAEHRNWLLFFDEADALFGKRTVVKNSNDRFANQEVSYLLQRIEGFDGTVILASNDKKNIDDAFARRFQMIVHFPAPTKEERHQIWNKMLPVECGLLGTPVLRDIAHHYELSGGEIVNVVRHAAVKAAEKGGATMAPEDLVSGIAVEYEKLGKFMPSDLQFTNRSHHASR